MFLHKTNFLLRALYPRYKWRVRTSEKVIYLTFDDGPIPEVTEFVVETLKQHQAKATFFCIGDNIKKHPTIFESVQKAGHSIGNHTFNHLNGWKTEDDRIWLTSTNVSSSWVFRPGFFAHLTVG